MSVALGFPEDPDDAGVAERVASTARDASDAVAKASALLRSPFGDLPTTQTAWTSTVMQYLPPDGQPLRIAYLADLDDPAMRGTLAAGRWPAAPGEVALPTSAARALSLDVGELDHPRRRPRRFRRHVDGRRHIRATTVHRVGRRPARRNGVSPNYRGYITAYGPFVVAPGGLAASQIPLRRVTVRLDPDLSDADATDLVSPERVSTHSRPSWTARWATAPRTSWWTCRSRARSTLPASREGSPAPAFSRSPCWAPPSR